MTARHLRIAGRVQGVGYRAWLAAEAERLGLAGWVRNRRDGTVEAVLAGDEGALDAVVERCRQGPATAAVRNVVAEPCAGDEVPLGSVELRPTV